VRVDLARDEDVVVEAAEIGGDALANWVVILALGAAARGDEREQRGRDEKANEAWEGHSGAAVYP
jgi:hypothetical protein